jgi:hypothetical protein
MNESLTSSTLVLGHNLDLARLDARIKSAHDGIHFTADILYDARASRVFTALTLPAEFSQKCNDLG